MENTEIRRIEGIIQPLVGRQAWGVRQGVGNSITMEFGAPIPIMRGRRPVRGEWDLWVWYCSWLLCEGSEFVAASEDSDERIALALQRMEGATLAGIAVRPPALDTTITFNGNVRLRLFPCAAQEHEHWMLFTPDRNVLIVGPGSRWQYQSEDEP